jgi:hypothetical protein
LPAASGRVATLIWAVAWAAIGALAILGLLAMGLNCLPLLIALPLGVGLEFISRCRAMWGLFVGIGLTMTWLAGRLVLQMAPCDVGTFTPPPGGCYSRETLPALGVGLLLILCGLAAGASNSRRAQVGPLDRQ